MSTVLGPSDSEGEARAVKAASTADSSTSTPTVGHNTSPLFNQSGIGSAVAQFVAAANAAIHSARVNAKAGATQRRTGREAEAGAMRPRPPTTAPTIDPWRRTTPAMVSGVPVPDTAFWQ
ncbi:hypothetical protein GCM10010464_35780 [Pseudonocardia yunnanensis]